MKASKAPTDSIIAKPSLAVLHIFVAVGVYCALLFVRSSNELSSSDRTDRLEMRGAGVGATSVNLSPSAVPAHEKPEWAIPFGEEFWLKKAIAKEGGSSFGCLDLSSIQDRIENSIRIDAGRNEARLAGRRYLARFGEEGAGFVPRHSEPRTVSTKSAFSPEEEVLFRTVAIQSSSGNLLGPEPGLWSFSGNTAQKLLNSEFGIVEHFQATKEGMELTWVIQKPPPRGTDLQLSLAIEGNVELKSVGNGKAFYSAKDGLPMFEVTQPVLVDSKGRRVSLDGDFAQNRLAVIVDHELLTSIEFPIAIDPIISPSFQVDDAVVGMSYWDGFRPSIASSRNGYFVAWASGRPGNTGVIVGTRIGEDYRALDPDGIILNQERLYLVSSVSVATLGSSHLVVWKETVSPLRNRIKAALVVETSRGFTVQEFSLADGPVSNPQAASNGQEYMIVWENDQNGVVDLLATRFTERGAFLDVEPLQIANGLAGEPSVQIAGIGTDQFLFVWRRAGPASSEVVMSKLLKEPAGIVVQNPVVVAQAFGSDILPDLAVLNDQAIVVWEDVRDGNPAVYGAKVGLHGAARETVRISSAGIAARLPKVAPFHDRFLVVWEQGDPGATDIHGAFLRSQDQTESFPIYVGEGAQIAPDVAGGNEAFVVWENLRSSFEFRIRHEISGAPILTSGAALGGVNAFPISIGLNHQDVPQTASNGSLFLAVWRDFRSGPSSGIFYGVRISPDGRVLDPEGIQISKGQISGFARPTSNGRDFVVVWEQNSSFNVSGVDIRGATISGDPFAKDVKELVITEAAGNQFSPEIASDGNGYLVVWKDHRDRTSLADSHSDIYGVHLDSNGARISLDTPIENSSIISYNPEVAGKPGQYLVMWENSRASILGSRLTSQGTNLNPDPLVISDLGIIPRVASNGDSFFVVWIQPEVPEQGGLNIWGRHITDQEMSRPIRISSAPQTQTFPVITSDGREYFAAWEDGRNSTLFASRSDIYGARISSRGENLDGDGLPLAVSALGQRYPAIAGIDSSYLFLYQAPAGGALRVTARLLSFENFFQWSNRDIGTVNTPGGAILNGDHLLLRGAGIGFSGMEDSFQLVAQFVGGNGELSGRLIALDTYSPASIAGLMFRGGWNPDSQSVSFGVNQDGQLSFAHRISDGGRIVVSRVQQLQSLPVWLKLVRKDDAVIAFWSQDGIQWHYFWFVFLPTSNPLLAGWLVASGDRNVVATATFNRVSQFKPLSPGAVSSRIPRLHIGGNSPEELQLFFSGATNQGYTLEASTNLVDWTMMTTIDTGDSGGAFHTDQAYRQLTKRFYRSKLNNVNR